MSWTKQGDGPGAVEVERLAVAEALEGTLGRDRQVVLVQGRQRMPGRRTTRIPPRRQATPTI
jgi:hypothetical protein